MEAVKIETREQRKRMSDIGEETHDLDFPEPRGMQDLHDVTRGPGRPDLCAGWRYKPCFCREKYYMKRGL